MVFPGQGSQSVGMLADLAASYPVIEATFREASDALGYDLWALTQQGPAEELNKTWQTLRHVENSFNQKRTSAEPQVKPPPNASSRTS